LDASKGSDNGLNSTFRCVACCSIAFLILQCPAEISAQVARLELISEFGEQGDELGQFFYPEKVTVDPAGRIIVSDTSNDRIQICSQQGECTSFGESGSQSGQFEFPIGVEIDDEGNLVIADAGNDRIQVCNYSGDCRAFQTSTGDEPRLSWPLDLVFDSKKQLHIINSGSYLICPKNGDCYQAVDNLGNEIAFQYAQGMTIDRSDRVLIADQAAERILVCEHASGCEVLLGFDAPIWLPRPPGSFEQPSDVSIDNDGRIYVSGRLQICNLNEGQCYVAENFGGSSVTVGSDGLIYVTQRYRNKVLVARLLELSDRFPINSGLNGSWYNPETPGQGIFVNVFPETKEMFAGWFTFDAVAATEIGSAVMGDTRHRWLTAQGNYQEDTATLQVFLTEGGTFLSGVPSAESDVTGELIISFVSCSKAAATFSLLNTGGELLTGTIPLVRISDENLTKCQELASETYP
jgi:sugar lactone lactonase YvrE